MRGKHRAQRLIASRAQLRCRTLSEACFGTWQARAAHSAETRIKVGRFAQTRQRDMLAEALHAWQAQAQKRVAKRSALTCARHRVTCVRWDAAWHCLQLSILQPHMPDAVSSPPIMPAHHPSPGHQTEYQVCSYLSCRQAMTLRL